MSLHTERIPTFDTNATIRACDLCGVTINLRLWDEGKPQRTPVQRGTFLGMDACDDCLETLKRCGVEAPSREILNPV